MRRPLLNLWPYLWPALMPLPLFLGFLLLASFLRQPLILAPVTICILVDWGQKRWLWRFTQRIWGFQTHATQRSVLHYATLLADRWNLPLLQQRCESELDDIGRQFGFTLRRRLVVYLFATWRDINAVFGPAYGGTALPLSNALVIPEDCNLQEVIRHELTHLFAARWNTMAPPLLGEGLATWLQSTVGGLPIDTAARPLLRNRSLKLTSLLKRSFFFAEPQRHSCYVLAGSFTGFLIRRFGWDSYRSFYRVANARNFRGQFGKLFGLTLEQAERRWRNELLAMEILAKRLRAWR